MRPARSIEARPEADSRRHYAGIGMEGGSESGIRDQGSGIRDPARQRSVIRDQAFWDRVIPRIRFLIPDPESPIPTAYDRPKSDPPVDPLAPVPYEPPLP